MNMEYGYYITGNNNFNTNKILNTVTLYEINFTVKSAKATWKSVSVPWRRKTSII